MNNLKRLLSVALLAATAVSPCAVYADAISPQIRDTGKVYSREKPETDFYGTGVAGRATEASELRFQVERDIQDGDFENAVKHAKRAVQFDPTDPTTHLLLARALTKVFYTKTGAPDERLLRECLYEWQMLWHHDSDQWDQMEAKTETRRLMKIAKAIVKQRREEQTERERAKEELARARRQDAAKLASRPQRSIDGADTKTDGKTAPAETSGAASSSKDQDAARPMAKRSAGDADDAASRDEQTAPHRKRFGIF